MLKTVLTLSTLTLAFCEKTHSKDLKQKVAEDRGNTFWGSRCSLGKINNLFTQNGLTSPFSAYNIKTKLKVKACQLVQKIVAKVRQAE